MPSNHYIVCIRCGGWKIKTTGCVIDLATEDVCDDCLRPDDYGYQEMWPE